MMGAAGAVAGLGVEIFNPLKKLKMLERGAEALEAAGDFEKAAKLRKEAEQLKKEMDEAEKAKRARSATEDGGDGARSTGKKRTRNPCAHLAKGNPNGEGPYRGGSYDGTKGAGEDRESDHIPPKSVSPLNEGQSPAISKDKLDHRDAMSTGSSREATQWRKAQQDLIDAGRYRDALPWIIDIRAG